MADITVRQFRQILLWPLQLTPTQEGVQIQKHSELFAQVQNNPWSEVADPFCDDQTRFLERNYREFVTFLPHVQRFLYGQGMGDAVKRSYGESPIRAFRRSDLAKCWVPCDHVPVRSWPLFRARQLMRDVIESFKQDQAL